MRTTDYSKLAACAPLDQTAAAVTGQAGCEREGEADPQGGQIRSRNPLPLRRITGPMACSPSFINFTGARLGDLTVIGLLKPDPARSKKQKAQWVVRCVCGTYETRTAKTLRLLRAGEKQEEDSMCGDCHKLQYHRSRYSHRRKSA